MYTVFVSPTHILPQSIEMPALKDDLGGPMAFRRQWPRPLARWELNAPGAQDKLEAVQGLLEHVQGDTPFWFDGAATIEVIEPILIGIGDGVTGDVPLPHKHVFVSSTVIYHNDAIFSAWNPLGGDGVTMAAVRFTAAVPLNTQVTAKYRRKAKVVLETDSPLSRERSYRSVISPERSIYRLRFFLQEVSD